MSDPAVIAASLTYMQRKALRRLGRGQTISRTQAQDFVVRTFYTLDFPEAPQNPNVVEWTDFAFKMNATRPRINALGRSVLEGLSNE